MRNNDYGNWVVVKDGTEYVVVRQMNIRRGWGVGNIEEWDRYFDPDQAEEVAETLNAVD